MRYRSAFATLFVLTGFSSAREPITVYLAGDSTMAPKLENRRPETGWGEMLQAYFPEHDVRIANKAMNGRSTRSFINEMRWQAIVDSLKAGDYVLIQFGHNDAAKDRPDRYTPPDDYRRNLARFVTEVRARQGNPVLLTPVRRRRFDTDGKLVDTHGEYPGLVRAVASELGVPLVDMHERTAEILTRYGADSSRALFLQLAPGANPNYPAGIEDNTHFSPLGARLTAESFVAAIREMKLPLVEHLASSGKVAPRGFASCARAGAR